MPPRRHTRTQMAAWYFGHADGTIRWDGRTGEPAEGQGFTTEEWDEAVEQMDALYVKVIESIDWRRVMFDASSRHAVYHQGQKPAWRQFSDEQPDEDVCDECIREAILTLEPGATDWEEIKEKEGAEA